MKKYEYLTLYEGEAGPTIEELLNEHGKEGWRLISLNLVDGYKPTAFLEREINE